MVRIMAEQQKHVPFVSSETNLAEFTIRALIIGLFLSIILGAANAYLGLKAGMTIASSYPAAVIAMSLLRIMKGTLLEENLSRTIGSVGGAIAAGAIFSIPAFYISGLWTTFYTFEHYIIATSIMFCGGLLGVMFVTLLRGVMVADVDLPFPESVAAAEIHKAGRRGGTGAKFLFSAMGVGGFIYALGQFSFFATAWQGFISFAKSTLNLKSAGTVAAQGGLAISSPAVSPAFLGVGYIIGSKLASLVFSGSLIAWGLLVPIILYFLSPELITAWQQVHPGQVIASSDWINFSIMVWKNIVRPIAIGGMLTGAVSTLFKMRKNLIVGFRRFSDIKNAAKSGQKIARVDHDINLKWIFTIVVIASVLVFFIYYFFVQSILIAVIATIVMVIIGFFFAAISGYLSGIIGASNNPVSGLTLSSLVIAALLMVALGMSGKAGVAAALGVAAIVCASSAIASDMMQDLKAGYILGGTPWRMQFGNIISVAIASAIMFLPLLILNQGDINAGKMALHPYEGGFGSLKLAAPQAGLMALIAQGIVSGQMAWPLIIVGILMGCGFILMQVRSPMLTSIGMYLPLETTSAIFIGGLIKSIMEKIASKKKFNAAQNAKVENVGTLLAAGLIAGEALIALVFAGFAFFEIPLFAIFSNPSILVSILVFIFLAWYLIRMPLKHAGPKDQEMPPQVS